jgi:hypothetical protein
MSGTVALWFNNCSLCLINLLKTCRLYSLHITQQRRGGSSPGAIKEAVIDHRSENGTPGKIALIQTPVLPSLIILQGMKRTPPNILFFCLQCISMRPICFFSPQSLAKKYERRATGILCPPNIYAPWIFTNIWAVFKILLSFHYTGWLRTGFPVLGFL